MICAVLAADYGLELLGRLKGLRSRAVIAALCCVVCFFTGALAVARECKSDYQAFSAADVQAAEFVEKNTDQHAMFMTGPQHLNFVSSLAGRNIVCGPDLWLYWHGYNTAQRHADVSAFYADPENQLDILKKYGVEYIVVSNHERGSMTVNQEALDKLFSPAFDLQLGYDRITIYRVEANQ